MSLVPPIALTGRLWSLLAVGVVIVGVATSLSVASVDAGNGAARSRQAFRSSASAVASTLKLSIQHEQDLVVNAAAFMAANPASSQTQFLAWSRSVRALARYPELQGIGFVAMVPAAKVAAFEAAQPGGASLSILPPGKRPFYCLGRVGQARQALGITFGLDFCALNATTLVSRDTGRGSYFPLGVGSETWLAVDTPVYRGGTVPATVQARRAAFLGWLGEAIDPSVVLGRALQGHPDEAVSLRYGGGSSAVVFHSGKQSSHGASAMIDLQNGWTVTVTGARPAGGMVGDRSALTLLVGGTTLSLLLGLLLFVLATGRSRALRLVSEKTHELGHQALHDQLTGLPNRALVLDRAGQLLARSRRDLTSVPSALFIDIDGFKNINDTYGHAAGDHVLIRVGERLQRLLREHDTVGRLGGDEFIVLLESSTPDAPPTVIATRLIDELSLPFPLPGTSRSVTITASIGIAIGQRDSGEELLRDADFALYEAKALGKDRYSVFEPRMQAAAQDRLALEADLGEALAQDQFFLLYQPTFDLETQEVLSIEALIRWNHPTRGIVAPDTFIPVAEATGLISAIGRWVLLEACRQLAAWQKMGSTVGISVNVSAYQLDRDGLTVDVEDALARSGIDAGLLTLEITETALMHDVAAAAQRLAELKALGVRLAIDDFGTGYSSLAYLRQFPVDALKIDRSFISNIATSSEAAAIIHTLVQLGKTLRIETLAEGIEDHDQLLQLQLEQCDQGQGFIFSRPVDANAIQAFLQPLTDAPAAKRPARSRRLRPTPVPVE